MQVDHELAERAFQPRQRPAQHDEARAGQLRRGGEIHQRRAPRRARNAASAGSRGRAARRPASARRWRFRPAPSGTSGSRILGSASRMRLIASSSAAALLLQALHLAAQRRRLRLPAPRCRRRRACPARPREQIALRRACFSCNAVCAARRSASCARMLGRRGRQAAARQGGVECGRIGADGADVMHGSVTCVRRPSGANFINEVIQRPDWSRCGPSWRKGRSQRASMLTVVIGTRRRLTVRISRRPNASNLPSVLIRFGSAR